MAFSALVQRLRLAGSDGCAGDVAASHFGVESKLSGCMLPVCTRWPHLGDVNRTVSYCGEVPVSERESERERARVCERARARV